MKKNPHAAPETPATLNTASPPEAPCFTAIDFETAQGARWSICKVALVRIEAGTPSKEISVLVRPPDNYYWDSFTGIHGIGWEDTIHAHNFAQVWRKIASWIEGQTVVAHNGKFDFTCLKQSLDFYGLAHPEFRPVCTYEIYGKGLAQLCEEHQIPLTHHDPLSDARACAELYLKHLKRF